MSDASEKDGYRGWAILELMGHRRLAGYVLEQEIAGHGFIRIDVYDRVWIEGEHVPPVATQFYSPNAVYCLTPTTPEIAIAVAKSSRPEPVARWELPAPEPRKECAAHPGSGHLADSPACDRMRETEARESAAEDDDGGDYDEEPNEEPFP